jgi:glutathione S-transferase
MMNFMPEERRNADVINFQAGRLAAALKIVETQLTNQTWLAAGEMTIADIAAAGYLFYEEPFTFDRKEYPHIDRWLDAIAAQPGWKHPYDMMPGSPADRA